MANKKEEPIANDETGKIKVKAKKEKQPDGNETKGDVTKVKAKMQNKPEVQEQTLTKVDISKPVEQAQAKETIEKVEEPIAVVEEVIEEVVDKPVEETTEMPVVEEITGSAEEVIEETANVVEEALLTLQFTYTV